MIDQNQTYIAILKTNKVSFFCLLLIFTFTMTSFAQEDGLSPKQLRQERRNEFKKSISISGNFVWADIETSITFTGPNEILSATISLENNLGLEKLKLFFTSSVLWRITPRSGIYGGFYRIYRKKTYPLDFDLPFLEENFPNGSYIDTYYNTDVMSLGYMFTLVDDENAFLGAFINLYMMSIKTGVNSKGQTLSENVKMLAPLPDIGLLAIFSVTKWLSLKGKFAIFALRAGDYSGKINDLSVGGTFKVKSWLGINLSYNVFNISLLTQEYKINALVEYDYRGPALGVNLKF